MDMSEKFRNITVNYKWGVAESMSGLGSTVSGTSTFSLLISKFLIEADIKSIVDIPCGDFNWQYQFLNNNIRYVGYDLIQECVDKAKQNANKYGLENCLFDVKNIIEDKIPCADLILVRDCLVHLPLNLGEKAIENILNSDCKYFAITTFPGLLENKDIDIGGWRKLNMEIHPFNLGKPDLCIVDWARKGKFLGVWKHK